MNKSSSKRKKLRTAVIGLGRAGWQMHIPEILRHEGFELIAVVDPLSERTEEARKEFNVKGYSDCKALFENERLDLVVIVSPTHFHVEQTIASFKNGVDVLCDKPMAPNLDEADRMIRAMKKYGRKMMVYQPHRAYVDTVSLQAILKKNIIGPVFMMKRAWSWYRFRVDWQAFLKYGGGELNNSGAHFIDQLLYLSCSRLKRLHCSTRKIISRGDAEDMVKIVMETENGMILDLDINFAAAIPITPFQVFGEHGTINWDEKLQAWYVRYYDKEKLSGIDLQNSLAATDRSYMQDQNIPWQERTFFVNDFEAIDFYGKCYDYFMYDKRPFVPIEQSREIMRIIEECKKQAKK
jgi:predicted dehydrogenase